MLDLKDFLQTIKTFKTKEIRQQKSAETNPQKSLAWFEIDRTVNPYSAIFVDGSMIAPSRHFGNTNFGFACACAVAIDYKRPSFEKITLSEIIDVSETSKSFQNERQLEISEKMRELEFKIATDTKTSGYDFVFFDMSLDYILNNSDKQIALDNLYAICKEKTAIFYTSNRSIKTHGGSIESIKALGASATKNMAAKATAEKLKITELELNYSTFLVYTGACKLKEFSVVEVVSKVENEHESIAMLDDQLKKGSGYPRGLELAHNFCTIGAQEAELFHIAVKSKSSFGLSAKQTKKHFSAL